MKKGDILSFDKIGKTEKKHSIIIGHQKNLKIKLKLHFIIIGLH